MTPDIGGLLSYENRKRKKEQKEEGNWIFLNGFPLREILDTCFDKYSFHLNFLSDGHV